MPRTLAQPGIHGVLRNDLNRRHPVTGAQGTDNYTDILAKLAGMRE